ncbi:MAG: glycoside hydrolase family 97 protein [Puniceicoccales bacterium]|jgi:alpha-glucosidase|nr:glycoside hydrolase family 97 protein [Puniceicoccales bacterium]
MKKILLYITAACGCFVAFAGLASAKQLELVSPDNSLKISVRLDDKIYYTIANKDGVLLSDNTAQLKLRGETLGEKPQLLRNESTAVRGQEIKPVVPFKSAIVKNDYNGLLLDLKGDYSIEFRAFDDGVAYRFITRKTGKIDVLDEDIGVHFPGNYLLHYQNPGKRGLTTCYEEPYSHKDAGSLDSWAILPILIDTKKGPKILFSEADINDYPNAFFKKADSVSVALSAFFPRVPTATKPEKGRYIRVTQTADYIARTDGTRAFPWRFFIVTKNDGQLLESTIVARLAPKNAIADTSWIKPGLSAWDWMNRGAAFPAKTGFQPRVVNTLNCKLYIDYAARNHIPYYIIDEGWSADPGLPQKTKPVLDLPEVLRYAKEKGVGIVLWITYLGIQRDFDDDSYNLFEYFSRLGVVGFKIDFMDRSDQEIVNFYERAAAEAAKYKMLVELHGSYKPVGLEYKYPNILSFEGVLGMENHLNCRPDNSLYLPFIRNVVGPMSFTPGSLINVQPEKIRGNFNGHWPMIGTRAHHIAYYILFDSGLQMIADSPQLFDKNPEIADFIYATPVTWHETRALAAEVGQYAIAARRHGDKWWLGGIANNAQKNRQFDVTLDFLAPGKTYTLTVFEDAPDAGENAAHYTHRKQTVKHGDKLHINLVRNGGIAAVIE